MQKMTTILELHTKLKAKEKYGLWLHQVVVDKKKYLVTRTPDDKYHNKFLLIGRIKKMVENVVVTKYRFVNKKWINL